MFKNIIAVVTWPYRYANNFVDTRPSAEQIKTHLSRHIPVIEVSNKGKNMGSIVSLNLAGTDLVASDVLAYPVEKHDELPLAEVWAKGVDQGYMWAVRQANNLKRSEFRHDSKVLKAALKLARADEKLEAAEAGVTDAVVKAGHKHDKAIEKLVKTKIEDIAIGAHAQHA